MHSVRHISISKVKRNKFFREDLSEVFLRSYSNVAHLKSLKPPLLASFETNQSGANEAISED